MLVFLIFIAIIPILIKLYIKLSTGFCRSHTCLVGKTTIITGSNTGLGYETALDFAKRGAKVILACRDREKGEKAQKGVIEKTGNPNVHLKLVDMASFKSVVQFSKDILSSESRLDILVNNAGLGGLETLTEDGLPTVMQVNHFSAFLLTNLLLDLLKKTENSRIVNVASIAAGTANMDVENPNKTVTSYKMYSNSKLANILFTRELAKKLSGTSVTTYSVYPGIVVSDFFRNLRPIFKHSLNNIGRFFLKNSHEGAQTQIFVSVAKNIEMHNGRHFADCKIARDYITVKRRLNSTDKFWRVSEKICEKYL